MRTVTRTLSHPEYRPDVDGLRALAVLLVVVFHAFPGVLDGGFVGVDVFFVISGFLISTLVLQNLAQGRFGFRDFYVRRVRRIFPALLLVLLASYGAGVLLLYKDEFQSLGEQIAAAAAFASNLLFWKEAGYFDVAAVEKPLLHLWSLGVEEQFYLAWPLLLWLAWRRPAGLLAWTLAILLASFLLGALGLAAWPAATFYLPFARFWELLVGAALAWFLLHRAPQAARIERDWGTALSILGLALILDAGCVFSRETPFPGLWAALPVAGAALVILAGPASAVNRKVLSHRVLVGIGLVSFPLYLWHWPLLAFARIAEGDLPSLRIRALAVTVAGVLACVTYLAIERPVRRLRHAGAAALVLCLLAIGAGALGMSAYLSDAPPQRFQSQQDLRGTLDQFATGDKPDASVMLVGDSHAAALYWGLNRELQGDVVPFAFGSCIRLFHVDLHSDLLPPGTCSLKIHKVLSHFEASNQRRTIVLSSMGPVYLTGEEFKRPATTRVAGFGMALETDRTITDPWAIYEIALKETLRRLAATGKRVIFVFDVPELGFDPVQCADAGKAARRLLAPEPKAGSPGRCVLRREEYEVRNRRYKDLVRRVLREFPEVLAFDPAPLFCDASLCHDARDGKELLYADPDHLSRAGSEYLAKHLAELIRTGAGGP